MKNYNRFLKTKNYNKLNESIENEIIFQKQMSELFMPLIKEEGNEFKKTGKIEAKPAKKGEKLETYTSDGKETENIAKEGDWKIKNIDTFGEEYFINNNKFKERYKYSGENNIYLPIGECKAIQLKSSLLKKLNLPNSFYFIAPWNEKMIAKKDDFLATTDEKEIYRIAEKEFHNSYRIKKEKPTIFEETLYDNIKDFHLEEIEYFRINDPKKFNNDKIFKGLFYTVVGRGIVSKENKNKIIEISEKLVKKFPKIKTYKKVLEKAKDIKNK